MRTIVLASLIFAAPPLPAAAPHVAVLTTDQVVQILDETVDWYRTLGIQQQAATQPSDLLILYANRQTADKVIGLAFEIARANAELLSSESAVAEQRADVATSAESLAKMRQQLAEQRSAIEAEIAADRKESGGAAGAKKKELDAKLAELAGELAMVNARANFLDTMAEFVGEVDAKGFGASALKAHIDAIAASIPATSAGAATPAAAQTSPASSSASTAGLWELGVNVLRLNQKLGAIGAIDARTASLDATFSTIRTPPLAQLKALAARGDALAAEADRAGSGGLTALRAQFDTLAWLFKQTSAILIPLSKEGVLLKQYRHNLASWREAARNQYRDAVKALLVRLGILLGMLAVVFVAAELWRRAVLRYAPDPRRRYQLLLVRNITLWTLVVVIIGLTFATELSSFVTFAGLLTAGVAVAMQNVLISVVGYFFLIGKYGIRIGDRVQIGTVTGEVIDLGLVRIHLMELGGQGPLGPTGRVVAFANSIVFQASGGLFKQIPGVNFTWREMTWTLPAGCDYRAVKEELATTLASMMSAYREAGIVAGKDAQKTGPPGHDADPQPQVHLRFSASGVDAIVRYPVHAQHEAEIDERVSQAVANVIAAAGPPVAGG